MKTFFLSFICLISLFFTGTMSSGAAGIMGSDITWTCVGQDSFLIKLKLFTDCNEAGPGNEMLSYYCAANDSFLFSDSMTRPVPVDITPTCKHQSCTRCSDINCTFPYGYQQYIYTRLVIFTSVSCCNIKIRFSECCRNKAITNIDSGKVFYTEAVMNRCLSPCDNSPRFVLPPVELLCIGQDHVRGPDLDEIDIGPGGGLLDSFTFEWTSPLVNPDTPVSFISGYSYDKPIFFWGFPNANLPFPRGFHSDSVSGAISFRPMKVEQAVMTLKVNEFRNGVKIGELRREMQVIVINCPTNHGPSLAPALYYKEVCAGSNVFFTISTNDLDPDDTLTISWNHGISGGSWSDNNGTVKHPTGTFTWNPGENQASSVPYSFVVIVKDDGCPVSTVFSHAYQVLVKPKPRASITVTDSGGGKYWFSAKAIQGKGPVFTWESDSFMFSPAAGPAVSHVFSSAGRYPFRMTITAQGCSRIYHDTANVKITSMVEEEYYSLRVSPNPADHSMNISTGNPSVLIRDILLYNQTGQQVLSIRNINSRTYLLQRKKLESGIYFLEIRFNDKGIMRKKIAFE